MDTATAFYPWYAYLGQSLASGHIPMWNPYQFAGTPFAADPESGWAYLPAMLFFAVLPLSQAVASFMLFHVVLASVATYAFARSLGMHKVGAFAAAFAYSHSGFWKSMDTYKDALELTRLADGGAPWAPRTSARS